ncbi:hypothetical protein BAE44_0019715 [Dichanthelium oligosanthes]|uniref:Uncharacterized protein n=1 Tax=Dichanthelium oligosanthes TaxID=888268 RepID=A0A1E5V273_9POAL|nr:hypothetical protein BAE44_0019715 [Dichanthelium oligosanthes]
MTLCTHEYGLMMKIRCSSLRPIKNCHKLFQCDIVMNSLSFS